MSTSDNVVGILINEGEYSLLPNPLKVGSLSFDFTHALVASQRANDLVIVIELKGETSDDVVIRKVFALTRALDVLRSKRPVTAVLTTGQPSLETVQSLSKVCRVLAVSASGHGAPDALRDSLAVLLPLTDPPSVETMLDWEADLRSAVSQNAKGDLMDALVMAAPGGRDAVEKVLASDILDSVNTALDDEGEVQ